MNTAVKHTDPKRVIRDRHDAGRAAGAGRWFSSRTIRSAERFRDLGWVSVSWRILAAIALIAAARAFRAEAFAPFALIGGCVWLAFATRVGVIKALDAFDADRF